MKTLLLGVLLLGVFGGAQASLEVQVNFSTGILTLYNKAIEVYSYPVVLPKRKYEPRSFPVYAMIRYVELRPKWRPTANIREDYRRKYKKELPEVMGFGPSNPMGARKIHLDFLTEGIPHTVKVHGTNKPYIVDRTDVERRRVSYGCIRMKNPHIKDLLRRIRGVKSEYAGVPVSFVF